MDFETPPPGSVKVPIRLAIRREGKFVNAYIAKTDTMIDATHVGAIIASCVDQDPKLFQDWKSVMRGLMNGAVERATGVRPVGNDESPAPEHERAGHS